MDSSTKAHTKDLIEFMSPEKMTSSILSFWFGEASSPNYGKPRDFWFHSTPQSDQSLRHQFKGLYQKAVEGHLERLKTTPKGSLALVILLDQLPRNMYRGTAKAFASDAHALEVAKFSLSQGFDRYLLDVEKMFLYLPFQHSESLENQEKSVQLFRTLGDPTGLDYALQHQDIITRFGRFPHRNKALGRVNTPEEVDFLENFSGFGQG